MGSLLSFVLAASAGMLAVPIFVFFIEIVASFFWTPEKNKFSGLVPRKRIAIIVPAHNERIGLRSTLENLKSQVQSNDRLVVVADNCTDDTAAIAAAAGAEVVVRDDRARVGKGYALDIGV